jgi:hypothetical protein
MGYAQMWRICLHLSSGRLSKSIDQPQDAVAFVDEHIAVLPMSRSGTDTNRLHVAKGEDGA